MCSLVAKTATASLPLSCRARQSWREGWVYCWRGFFSLLPPHFYSSPQGGGDTGYWSWEHFICKCPCVYVQAPDLRLGASIHRCQPRWVQAKALESIPEHHWDGAGRPCQLPACRLGTKAAAPGWTLLQQPLSWWVWGHLDFLHSLHLGFPRAATVMARGDESFRLGSGNTFDYKFITELILPVAQGWLVSLSKEFVVFLASQTKSRIFSLAHQLISCLHLTLSPPRAFTRGNRLRFSPWPGSHEWVRACSYHLCITHVPGSAVTKGFQMYRAGLAARGV